VQGIYILIRAYLDRRVGCLWHGWKDSNQDVEEISISPGSLAICMQDYG
jgi:hypothetical protein